MNDRVKAENSQGKILQICHSDGTVKVDSTKIVENGILVEGIVQVRILYIIGDDEMPFYSMETMIPFSHTIEAENITENCVYHLRADLEQLSTTMIDSDEIEVKIVMNLNAIVLEQTDTGIIQEIQEHELDREKLCSMPGIVGYQVEIEVKIVMNLNAIVLEQTDTGIIQEIQEHELDREKLCSMPGIVGYQVQPQDSLWDIAKKFYTTIENIVQLNGLENENVKPYDTLILMKKVER